MIIFILFSLCFFPFDALGEIKTVACSPTINCAAAIQTGIDTATAGDIVQIPAGTFLIRSPMQITKPVTLRGVGRLGTVLVHDTNLGLDGASGIFHVKGTSDVTITGLTIRADRVANPSMRTTVIRIRAGSSGITVHDVGFQGITSSCVLAQGTSISNVRIVGNHADEYYEQFVEIAAGNSSNFLIANNTAKTTKGHPKLGTTEPFPIVLTPGLSAGGILDRVYILNNTFSHAGMNVMERVNTAGVQLSADGAAQGRAFGFTNIFVMSNKMTAQGRAVRIQIFRRLMSGPASYVAIENNELSNMVLEPIAVEAKKTATAEDFVFIAGNTIYLRESWPPYKIATLATVIKMKNQCVRYNSTQSYSC